jgi:hypothetical protein
MINNLKVSDSKILLCDVRCMTMNLIALGKSKYEYIQNVPVKNHLGFFNQTKYLNFMKVILPKI